MSPTLCDARHSQLVVIDIQERLAAAMKASVREQTVRHAGILQEAAIRLGIPVVRTEQYPQGLGGTVAPLQGDGPTLEKTCFSCFAASGFADALDRQRRQIVLAGIETHVCVLQTALEMHDAGYRVFVVEDAVCSRHKRHHRNALARLRQAGVVVSNVESVLFEWLRDAAHPAFKAVSRLIR